MLLCASLVSAAPVYSDSPAPASIAVRFPEGIVHGFLIVSTEDGKVIADGDEEQTARGDKVTSHMMLRFKDGSLQEETTIFTQRKTFRLLSDHLVQKGPTFKTQTDLTVDGVTGKVTVRYIEQNGEEKEISEQMKLPPNIANGIIPILLTNIPRGDSQMTLSMVVATPKPRLVKLAISAEGEDTFFVASSSYKATRYVMKMELGGVAGVVAPIIGKQPQDSHIWIMNGNAPTIFKSEGPQFEGGPSWRLQLASARPSSEK